MNFLKNQHKNDIILCLLIPTVGLISALFIYPFVHEFGHVITSFCVGGEVLDFTLFPSPSVLCDVGAIGNSEKIIISFGGMLLPLLVAGIVPRRWFWTWYIRVILKAISLLSFLLSVVSLTLNCNAGDDMVQALEYWLWDKNLLILLLCSIAGCIVISIVREKPIKRICKYFNI